MYSHLQGNFSTLYSEVLCYDYFTVINLLLYSNKFKLHRIIAFEFYLSLFKNLLLLLHNI
jgi:hypothetical protein